MQSTSTYRSTRFITIIVLMFLGIRSYGQQHTVVVSDPQVDTLIQRSIEENKQAEGIAGFRIQIYSASDRKGAVEARTKFLQLYPDADAYLIYQQPNFRVRIGDFRTKQEAHALFKLMLQEFPEVIIVPDKIKLPKL